MNYKLLCVIVLALSLSACGNKDKQEVTHPVAVQADVPTIYKNFCISCHGNNLQGGQGPNIQKIGERLDEAEIIKRIQKGGGGMPPFQVALKDEELKALAAWLAGLK
ncbi:cytochrome c [Paenibacillus sp. SYP-B3998]|uniref:Cytochrome c n=1 Tax=Paenibacillus sp. SYP-B3998 TaxID=2678564 RepID=A0A6G3ZXZ5_9BACL|nr:cytochrome c [Paenibacillus sp. SYP-B3998]NEW06985.1 cytochrome c [Paenibacillus sp. SYP-B3998]